MPAQSVVQLARETAIALKQASGLGFSAFSFNTTKAPFDDVRVRQAFTAAIDKKAILRAVFFGTGSVAYGAIPPSMGWVHDKDFIPH